MINLTSLHSEIENMYQNGSSTLQCEGKKVYRCGSSTLQSEGNKMYADDPRTLQCEGKHVYRCGPSSFQNEGKKVYRYGPSSFQNEGNTVYRFGPSTLQSGGKNVYQTGPNTLQCEENSHYVDELENISSNIIRLLHEAKQRNLKVNVTCETARSPHDLRTLEYLCSRDNMSDIWDLTQMRPPYDCHAISENACNKWRTRMPVPVPCEETGGSALPLFKKTPFLNRFDLLNEEINNGEHSCYRTNGSRHSATGHERRLYEYGTRVRSDGEDHSIDGVSNNKARQIKDLHNKVERRRRSIIRNRINEIKSLLPEHINRSESCRKKGSILQEAISYIKTQQSNIDRFEQLKQILRGIEDKYNGLMARIERLESGHTDDNHPNEATHVVQATTKDVVHAASAPKDDYHDVTGMPKYIFSCDETCLSKSDPASNLLLIDNCGIGEEDWLFHI